MTASAVRDVHAVLAGAFRQAQVWGWIDHSPMTLVTRPAVRRVDVRPPQVARPNGSSTPPWPRTRSWGCSWSWPWCWVPGRGEVCRLRWSHIDLDRGEVLVGGKITSLPGELRDEEWTKTRSKRRVAIGPSVVELLRARRVEQANQALAGRGQSLARRLCVQPRDRRAIGVWLTSQPPSPPAGPLSAAGLSPHRPQAWPVRQVKLRSHLEPLAAVERQVALVGRLQVGRRAFAIAAVEHRPQQRGAKTVALPGARNADIGQVVVGVAGMLLLDHGRGAKHPWQSTAECPCDRRCPAQQLAWRHLPVSGWRPHRHPSQILDRPDLFVRHELPQLPREEPGEPLQATALIREEVGPQTGSS
jgi:hypothetical protein